MTKFRKGQTIRITKDIVIRDDIPGVPDIVISAGRLVHVSDILINPFTYCINWAPNQTVWEYDVPAAVLESSAVETETMFQRHHFIGTRRWIEENLVAMRAAAEAEYGAAATPTVVESSP